jgi:hypothetical protein
MFGSLYSTTISTPLPPQSTTATPSTNEAMPSDNYINLPRKLNEMIKTNSMSSEFKPQIETIKAPKVGSIKEEEAKELASDSGGILNLKSIANRVREKRCSTDSFQSDEEEQKPEKESPGASPLRNPLSISTNFGSRESVTRRGIESIAWSFAQITGQFSIDSNYIKTTAFSSLSDKIMYSAPGSRNVAGGGGSFLTGAKSNQDDKSSMSF